MPLNASCEWTAVPLFQNSMILKPRAPHHRRRVADTLSWACTPFPSQLPKRLPVSFRARYSPEKPFIQVLLSHVILIEKSLRFPPRTETISSRQQSPHTKGLPSAHLRTECETLSPLGMISLDSPIWSGGPVALITCCGR